MSNHNVLAEKFLSLDALLDEHRHWWQFQPFHSIASRWQEQAPDLHAALQQLSPATLQELICNQQQRVEFLAHWIPAARDLQQLCELPRLAGKPVAVDHCLALDIGGRKWQQITAFAGLVPAQQNILEWCGGKGHLGRLLMASGAASVTSLEQEQHLCASGQALAARAGIEIRFHQCDVLTAELNGFLGRDTHTVALHACGQLHTHLLQEVVARQAQAVSLAPCCYYLIKDSHYQPLSQLAANSQLRLHKSDLHIPLRETVTGGARTRRQRSQELRWRLAFDCLQRDIRQVDEYLPLASIPRHVLGQSFADFALWAIAQKDLDLPGFINLESYLSLAEQRLSTVKQMELVQQLFQRPLELWLALDRALFMSEHNYQVLVGEFCDRHITPRNIFIQAVRQPHQAIAADSAP